MTERSEVELDELLAEQQRYYRARAPFYAEEALSPLGGESAAALRPDLGNAFDAHFGGDVLELACGPGTWTAMLAQRAATVTALDGAPEMRLSPACPWSAWRPPGSRSATRWSPAATSCSSTTPTARPGSSFTGPIRR